uniref:Uncharacterized protein n=1 Tax=Oryza brachyantha TaxID=4533 RepID=J3LB60_ORYBR
MDTPPPYLLPDLNADPPADAEDYDYAEEYCCPPVNAGDDDGLDEAMLLFASSEERCRKRLRDSGDDVVDEGEARGSPRRCRCFDSAEEMPGMVEDGDAHARYYAVPADESVEHQADEEAAEQLRAVFLFGEADESQEVDMAAAQSAGEDDHTCTMTGDGSAYAEDEEPEFRHFRRQGAGMAAQGFGQCTLPEGSHEPAADVDDEHLQERREQQVDMAAAGSEREITVDDLINEQLLERDFINKVGDDGNDSEMEVQVEDELDKPTLMPFIEFL